MVLVASAPAGAAPADPAAAAAEKQRCPRPGEFASVFSFGYGGDTMPKDDARFDELLRKIKDAGFNVVHCTYTDKRLESCRKHGVKMMVDFLADEHHVYKSADQAKALAQRLRGSPDVWGYNIWNESFGKTGPGRQRDILAVRSWDPTHPAYCGTYRTYGLRHLACADVMGYYDYHWKRGPHYHFPHLLTYCKAAHDNNSIVYRWVEAAPGQPGNVTRSLYTANTSIACGLKGLLWFLATGLMDKDTLQWTPAGQAIAQVHREIMPLKAEIMKIHLPSAVCSTPITRTANNEALPDARNEMMPPGLENNGFPKDFAVQPAGGEFVLGAFKDDQGRDAFFLANHNAYATQEAGLKFTRPVKVSLFDRTKRQWAPMTVTDQTVRLTLQPGGGELLRLEK
jgi:hypothetical protein